MGRGTQNIPMNFFFNDTATTEIYTLPLHDALPIFTGSSPVSGAISHSRVHTDLGYGPGEANQTHEVSTLDSRTEDNTTEPHSHFNLVCRLLLPNSRAHSHFPAPPDTAQAPGEPNTT